MSTVSIKNHAQAIKTLISSTGYRVYFNVLNTNKNDMKNDDIV